MKRRIAFLVGTLSLFLAAPLAAMAEGVQAGGLKISHGWSRSTPKLARVGVGYLTIENEGAKADRLIAIVCSCAKNIGMHETELKDGLMQMTIAPDGFVIPPHQTVILKPSSKHLMFMGLQQQFIADESFVATLTFEQAGVVDITFKIEPLRRQKRP